MSAFASDQSIDDLYVAQYLAMAALQTPSHDVSRFTLGRTATVPPDNVVVSVDWDRRETSITYTYAYRDGQNIVVPTPAASIPAQTPLSGVAAANSTGPSATEVASSPSAPAGSAGATSDQPAQPAPHNGSSMTSETAEQQHRSTNKDGNGHGPDSEKQQQSADQRDIQADAPTTVDASGQPTIAGAAPGECQTPQETTNAASTGSAATDAGKPEKARSLNKYRINIIRHANKIPKTDRYTEWYSSCTRSPLEEPPSIRRIPGMLYVHRHKHETEAKWAVQVWMFVRNECAASTVRKGLFLLQNREAGSEGAWVRVRPGHEHPDLPGYVLHFRETGEPSWVKAATVRAYRSRAQADS